MDDDQFKGQNTYSDIKESCRDNSVIQNSHLSHTTTEIDKNCSENEQSYEEIFNKQQSPSDRDISERQNSFHSGVCNSLPTDTADMHRVRS